jgi:pimeloyl-ACP methyl ester carboxylesterase
MIRTTPIAIAVGVVFVVFAIATGVVASQLPSYGANALLHPDRTQWQRDTPKACESEQFAGVNVELSGWRCRATSERKATIVYLHGVADNRGSAVGVVERFTRRGFDVIAYDSRAHGDSSGDQCTYGFYERDDLRKVIDRLGNSPVILIGHSLGAAVALQAAAGDPRIVAVVAASTFSDLRTIATERAPSFFSSSTIARAFAQAESDGRFSVEQVSPVVAAARITVPVLLIHGEADRDTTPSHSQRVFAALSGPKELIIVPSVGHNDVLRPAVWLTIEQWIDKVISGS